MGNVGYYNQNSEQFVQTTLNVNMESLYQAFLVLLPNGGHILDLGCGSGRDTLAFKNKGYQVEALDYSKALVEKATALTGIPVRYQSFYDLNDHGIYDGIWACASLLHVPASSMTATLQHLAGLLQAQGVLYVSFKYGADDVERNGRHFTNCTEQRLQDFLAGTGLSIVETWLTADQRPERADEQWLNALLIAQ